MFGDATEEEIAKLERLEKKVSGSEFHRGITVYLCRDCDYEFETPGTTTATDGIRGFGGPYYVDCCPRCRSENYIELYRMGECVHDES